MASGHVHIPCQNCGNPYQTLYAIVSAVLSTFKCPVTLCNFLSNLSCNAVARQVAGELHSVTDGLSRNFFVARSVARSRSQLYFSQRLAATGNTIAQCVSPLQHLVSQFYGSFNKGACAHILFFRSEEYWRDKLLRKLHSVTEPLRQF